MTIYIYSNETGKQVASYTGTDNQDCERWADSMYCSNDYHASYSDHAISNAVEVDHESDKLMTPSKTQYQNCQPADYDGTYPMVAISDDQETYCTAVEVSPRHTVDCFLNTYTFNFDDPAKSEETMMEELRRDLSVRIYEDAETFSYFQV